MENTTAPQNTNMEGYTSGHTTGYAKGYTDGANERDEMLRAAEAEALKEELEEMKQWAKETKVNAPIPRDLLPMLAKDPAKQMELAMKHMDLVKEK